MKVYKNKNLILQGYRSTNGDGLWDIPIPPPPPTINNQWDKKSNLIPIQKIPKQQQQTLNIIIRKDKAAKDLALYLHAACFSPTTHTFLKAIKNNHFVGWPGLTLDLIKKHLPLTPATVKGHLKQETQGIQSTTKIIQEPFQDIDMYPSSDTPNKKTHDVIYSITTK